MKKLVITLSLVLALVIAAAVSLPALAADTTTISVTIPANIIDVDIPDDAGAIDMGNASPTEPGLSEPPFTIGVGTNAPNGSTLQVADLRTTLIDKGFMDDGAIKLTNPTDVRGGDLGITDDDWVPLTSNQTLYTGTGPGEFNINGVQFQQEIAYADPAGTYSITVTFVATAN